jgi:hypothetical protein
VQGCAGASRQLAAQRMTSRIIEAETKLKHSCRCAFRPGTIFLSIALVWRETGSFSGQGGGNRLAPPTWSPLSWIQGLVRKVLLFYNARAQWVTDSGPFAQTTSLLSCYVEPWRAFC